MKHTHISISLFLLLALSGGLFATAQNATFTLPEGFAAEDVLLHFGGVESAYYCWLNGQFVGYSEDSRLPSEFLINKHLKSGENKLAVEVYRYSDGSYLEGQDYWKYSGIGWCSQRL